MSARKSRRMPGRRSTLLLVALTAIGAAVAPCHADVVTDWDAKATAVAAPGALGEREVAIVDLAMFDAVNSIAGRYRAYLVREDGVGSASVEAAAASAAATALAKLHPQNAAEFQSALNDYTKALPASPADVEKGLRLGERVALRIVAARASDGATGIDLYRPRTQPGVYVATTPMVEPNWPKLRPFVLASGDQFRPGPPVALGSAAWAADYNEVKSLGARDSKQRTAGQTEAARFWLMRGAPAYHPIARQIDAARHLTLVDSARWMAMVAVALTDAYIAVFDAKYRYEFWRPVTAIRNGDIDGNPATAIDPAWLPFEATPMHPEYPCAHCIESGTLTTLIERTGGLPEYFQISLTSSTAPGITHRWSSLEALSDEVADARVWAGFHYRSSARAGTAMGREVGRYIAAHFARPDDQPMHPAR